MEAQAFLIVGFKLARSDLFLPTSAPPRCKNGHEPPRPEAKFCDQDGHPFNKVEVQPLTGFAALAAEMGISPEELFQMWCRGDREGAVGFCSSSIYQGNNVKRDLLGMQVASTGGYGSSPHHYCTVNMDRVADARITMFALASRLGFTMRNIETFLGVYAD